MRKTTIFSQLLAAVLAVVVALVTPVSVIVSATAKEDFNYVSIGDSTTSGHGFDDSYPVSGDPDSSTRGYGVLASETYPALIADALSEEYNVNWTQLAANAMRPADVYYILRNDAVRDDYADRVFTAAGKVGYGNDSNGKGEQWIAKWAGYSGDLDTITAAESTDCEIEIHNQYVEAITNADLITVNIGYNNLTTFLTARLATGSQTLSYLASDPKSPLSALDYGDRDTLQDMLDAVGAEVDVDEIRAEIAEIVKYYTGNDLESYLKTNVGNIDFDLEAYIDILLHAYVSFAVYYSLMMNEIYKLNPDAEVVVIGLSNLEDDLTFTYGDYVIDFGKIYGVMLGIENVYMASCDPHCKDYYYVDATELDVTTFLDELASGTLSKDLRNRIVEAIFDFNGVQDMLTNGVKAMSAALAAVNSKVPNLGVDASIKKMILDSADNDFKVTETTVKNALTKVLDNKNYDDKRQTRLNETVADFTVNVTAYLTDSSSIVLTDLIGQISYLFGSAEVGYNTGVYGLNITFEELVTALLSNIFNVLIEAAKVTEIDIDDTLGLLMGGGLNNIGATIMSGNIDNATKGLLNLYLRFFLAEGVSCHPNAEGHATIATAVLEALETKKTAADYSAEIIFGLIQEYGPAIAKTVLGGTLYAIIGTDSAYSISADLIGSSDKLKDELLAAVDSLKDTKTALEGILNLLSEELGEDFTAAIDRVADCGNDLYAVLTSLDGTADDVTRTADALKDALDDVDAIFVKAASQITDATKNADAVMLAELENLSEILENIHYIIGKSYAELLNKVAEIVDEYAPKFIPNTAKATEVANTVRNAVNALIADYVKASAAAQEFITDDVLPVIENAITSINEAAEIVAGLVSEGYTEALFNLYKSIGDIYDVADDYEYAVETARAQFAELRKQVELAAEASADMSAAFTVAGMTVETIKDNVYTVYETLMSSEKSIEDKVATVGGLIYAVTTESEELAASFEQLLGTASETYSTVAMMVMMMYINASMAEYPINTDSFYVALGDSLNGYGLEGYSDNYGYGVDVLGSFSNLIANEMGVDYAPLSLGGLRTTDMLFILDESYAGDEYTQTATVDNINDHAGSVEAIRTTYTTNIEKADLITITLGGNDFGTFITAQLERFDAGEDLYEMDFSQFVDGEYVEAAYEAIEVISDLTLKIVAECGVDIDDNAVRNLERVSVMVESYLYSYLMYSTNSVKVLDRIHAINPDALVVVIGMYNTVDDLYYDDGDIYLPLGDMVNALVSVVNLELLGYAMLNNNTMYVDITDVSMFCDEDENRASTNLYDGEYLSYMTENGGIASHPSYAGHEYIAQQILGNLFWYLEYIPGDLDGDWELTEEDAIYLLYSLSWPDEYVVDQNADFNNDGVVDEDDAIHLLYNIYWPEDYVLYPEPTDPE